MNRTRRKKKGRRALRKHTIRKMRGGFGKITTNLTEQEINIMLDEFLVCKYVNVETGVGPDSKIPISIFIEKDPLLLRILTMTFIDLMKIDIKKAKDSTDKYLESFRQSGTKEQHTFITKGLNYIQFPPISIRTSNPPPLTDDIEKETGKDTSHITAERGMPEIEGILSMMIHFIYDNDSKIKPYTISIDDHTYTYEFNKNYLEVEKLLNERIHRFLASPYTDKKFGSLSNLTAVYKTIIIGLNDIITHRNNTSFFSSITNTATNLIVKPHKIKMYKYAKDYLRSQFSKYLFEKVGNALSGKVIKALISGTLFIVIYKIMMTCGAAAAKLNYTDPKCYTYIIILSILSGVRLSLINNPTDVNSDISGEEVKPDADKIVADTSHLILPESGESSKKELSSIVEKISTDVRKKVIKTVEETVISGANIGIMFITHTFNNQADSTIYKVIITAFSHAFFNSINPLLSKSPLIILFSEMVRMQVKK